MTVESSRRLKAPALLLGAALISFPAAVSAAPPKVPPWHLDYIRTPGTKFCPDKDFLMVAVGARIGYQPFEEDSPRLLRVTVVRTPKRLEALIEARDENGEMTANYKAWAALDRCEELLENAAVFLVDIVKPFVLPPLEEPAPPAPSPPSTITHEPPPASHPPLASHPAAPPSTRQPVFPSTIRTAPTRSRWVPKLAVSLGGGAAWWTLPATAMSLNMGFAARWPRFSLGAEGRYDIARKLPVNEGMYTASLVSGAVLACGHQDLPSVRGFLKGCIFSGVGLVSSDTEVGKVKDGEAPTVDLGLRFGGGLWLFGPLGIELHVDGAWIAHRPAIWLDETEVWRLPEGNIAVRAGFIGLFDLQ